MARQLPFAPYSDCWPQLLWTGLIRGEFLSTFLLHKCYNCL